MTHPADRARVLVVFRERALRDTIAGWVDDLGLQAVSATSVRAAVAAFQANAFGGVLVGPLSSRQAFVGLPARLRRVESLSGRPAAVLIAATGYVDEQAYDDLRAAGYDSVLPWPLREAALRTRLLASGLPGTPDTPSNRSARLEAEQLFERELRGDLAHLQRAFAARSELDIARWAHRIKGASLMFGHQEIGDIAASIEALGTVSGRLDETSDSDLACLMRQLRKAAQGAAGGLSSVEGVDAAELAADSPTGAGGDGSP